MRFVRHVKRLDKITTGWCFRLGLLRLPPDFYHSNLSVLGYFNSPIGLQLRLGNRDKLTAQNSSNMWWRQHFAFLLKNNGILSTPRVGSVHSIINIAFLSTSLGWCAVSCITNLPNKAITRTDKRFLNVGNFAAEESLEENFCHEKIHTMW